MTDFSQRFIFDNHDIRGELVNLEQSYAHVLAKHPYPEQVAELLGELMAAAALLVDTIKLDGLLILQARSSGAIPLLMVECSSAREIRAIARYDNARLVAGACLSELMPDGVLAITVEPRQGQRYQGLVTLDGNSLADSLDSYFASSEQLPSRFWLHADGRRARGMLLQQLPAKNIPDVQARTDSWQHVITLAQTLSIEELLGLDNETILYRLYHQDRLRLFDKAVIVFSCNCSRERSANALKSLGRTDVQTLLGEQQGCIEVDCQFCNETYRFSQADVTNFFDTESEEGTMSTVH